MNNYKKVEKMLCNYKMKAISIANMQEEIEQLKEMCGVGAMSYDSQPSNTNKINSIVENTSLSNMEQIEYLEKQIRRQQRNIDMIDRTLEGLSEVQRKVVTQRYIEGLEWYEVAGIVFRGERQCRNIRTEAINKMVLGVYGR